MIVGYPGFCVECSAAGRIGAVPASRAAVIDMHQYDRACAVVL